VEFLIVIEPASGGRYEHRLAPGSYVLGREEASCDIAILSPEVSRQHARIHLSAEQCTVEDLGSTAGTLKDGQALEGKQSFPFPAEVSLGTTRLTISPNEVVEMSFDSNFGGAVTVTPSAANAPDQVSSNPPAGYAEAGHYTKGREIARGGMGAILEANDRMLGRTVAMKVVLEERASEDARMRFIREATVLGQLEHPNIIPIHELGRDDDGNLFYAMKMVEGRTLQAIINDLKKGDAFTIEHYFLDRLLTIFRKICDAMAFAHSKGIVHRDLKPENVMVGAFGEVLVMDWGLAKILKDVAQTADELEQQHQALASPAAGVNESGLQSGIQELTDSQMRGSSEDLTMEGAVMGSPQYMPPEQAEGRITEVDERSDIYSLGGILYAILTLRPPMKGKTVLQVLENVKSGNITAPTEFNPGGTETRIDKVETGTPATPQVVSSLPHCPGGRVSSALASVTMKALSLEAGQRFASVGELAHDVEQWQGGFSTSAEQAGAIGELHLWIKRNRTLTAAAMVVVLLTAGFMAKVISSERKANANALLAAENEAKARGTLNDLRRTAPVFFEQAKADFEQGNRDAALEKLGYAISLDQQNADYHLFRANLHQSSKELRPAIAGYQRVLELRPDDETARVNLELSEELSQDSKGEPLTQNQLLRLLAALKEQRRIIEAAPIAAQVAPDQEMARQAILARIPGLTSQPTWRSEYVKPLPDGTFLLQLSFVEPIDFSVLKGIPVSRIHIVEREKTDFGSLTGLQLRALEIKFTTVGKIDLSFVKGMPLERLRFSGKAKEMNLELLRELPLKQLALSRWGPDLSFLRGMQVEKLILESVLRPDLESLRGLPLQLFGLVNSIAPPDFSPLLDCPTLEEIIVPLRSDPSVLRKLPRLRRISTRYNSKYGDPWSKTAAQTAEEFWREFDAKAKQDGK
jgi:serine/threonine protein kinase